jgi:hypothetical protein
MTDNTYDVLVIGAGPGGYVTAIRAAQLGLKSAVVEREHLGGICLNWGCIPTKALLRTAEVYHNLTHAKDYGLTAEKVGFDAGAIVKRSRAVAGRLTTGVGGLLKKNKVDVIWGEARITKPGEVQVSKPKKADGAAAAAAARHQGRGDLHRQAHHRCHRRAAPGAQGPGARRQAGVDLFRGHGARQRARSRCWSSARAPSASSSPRSTARSARR